jgi:hypothetical protein
MAAAVAGVMTNVDPKKVYALNEADEDIIVRHVATRVRRFLVERHRVSSHGTRCFEDATIFGELGVASLIAGKRSVQS